jgi:hypothetical protein
MIVAVAVICAFLILSTRSKALVPGRFQAVAEMLYEFVADMLRKRDGADSVRLYRDEPHHHHCGKHLPYLCSSQSLLPDFGSTDGVFLRVFVPGGIPIYSISCR